MLERNRKLLSKITTLSVNQIMEPMITVCLETYFVLRNGLTMQQIEGCPIGKALSCTFAGIFMQWWEVHFLENVSSFKFKLWKRMRDDILVVWSYPREMLVDALDESC